MSAGPRSAETRRIMAIWLPCLALDRWRHRAGCAEGEGADAQPFALVAGTAHGPRLAAVNAAARLAGIRPGMALTDARSLCPHLATEAADPAGDRAFLERLAAWARRWGPWSALDPPDGLLVDATAVAHLFGGEQAMLKDARAAFARRGIAARVALAPTAGAAWALAHYANTSLRGAERSNPERIARGSGSPRGHAPRDDELRHALASLPVAALRLDPGVLLVLRRLGLKRIGDLYGIGRDTLKRRFRAGEPAANPLLRLDQLLGRAAEPLLPVAVPEMPLAQRRLMEPIRHRELLDRVVEDLAADMARLLESAGEGARRLELGLWRLDGDVALRRVEMTAPTRDPAHICRLLARKLDDVDAGFGIELARLRAPWCEKLALSQGDLGGAGGTGGVSLAVCIDRLGTRLGLDAVSRPQPRESHLPERAQEWLGPFDVAPPQEDPAFPPRPLKLLDRAEEIAVLYATPDGFPRRFRWRGAVHEILRVEGPERIAPEWWREPSAARLRDYYRIEDGEGRRYWIYRHGIVGDGRGGEPQWFLQGLCA